jgi:signal transduction histidine kinase
VGKSDEELYFALARLAPAPQEMARKLEEAREDPGALPVLEFPLAGQGTRTIHARWFALKGEAGDSLGYGILFRDATREKELDQMKNRLLSIVSHELRTPLAAIKGFTTTLLRQDVTWDEPTQRDFLRIIDEETDRLSELIDNLLDMSQIEAGALRIDVEPVQLRNLVREAKDRAARRSEAHWFVVDLPANLPRVLADARRVRQVLSNLLENAIKYSPSGGQVTISCEVEGDQVVTSIADQGEGIAAENLQRIFDRFYQVDSASTRKSGGSGLGLSIAKGIIAAQGGRMWAESVPGQGSVFRFTLPIYQVADATGGDDA